MWHTFELYHKGISRERANEIIAMTDTFWDKADNMYWNRTTPGIDIGIIEPNAEKGLYCFSVKARVNPQQLFTGKYELQLSNETHNERLLATFNAVIATKYPMLQVDSPLDENLLTLDNVQWHLCRIDYAVNAVLPQTFIASETTATEFLADLYCRLLWKGSFNGRLKEAKRDYHYGSFYLECNSFTFNIYHKLNEFIDSKYNARLGKGTARNIYEDEKKRAQELKPDDENRELKYRSFTEREQSAREYNGQFLPPERIAKVIKTCMQKSLLRIEIQCRGGDGKLRNMRSKDGRKNYENEKQEEHWNNIHNHILTDDIWDNVDTQYFLQDRIAERTIAEALEYIEIDAPYLKHNKALQTIRDTDSIKPKYKQRMIDILETLNDPELDRYETKETKQGDRINALIAESLRDIKQDFRESESDYIYRETIKKFKEIGVNPVTIPDSRQIEYLPPIHELLRQGVKIEREQPEYWTLDT